MFSIGMATYDDFDGVYFTVQALLLYHRPHVKEIIIVDNHPGTRTSQRLKDLAARAPGCRYEPFSKVTGTAPSKNRVFECATGEYVVCIDSHILLLPDALQSLANFYRRDPQCGDLIQGPLVWDDHHGLATHLDENWGNDIKGTWQTAPPDMLARPFFEIGNMGMGLFACRKDSWLGYNPAFKGFGGEEWYIHQKYKKAGRKTICLTGLKWMHRFGDQTAAKPYPLNHFDRARNYFIGYNELGIPTAELKEHYVGKGHVNPTDWLAIESGSDKPCTGCSGAVPYDSLEKWHADNIATKGDLNEHLATMAGFAKDNIVADCGDRQQFTVPAWLAGGAKQVLYFGKAKFKGSDTAHTLAPGRLANIPENSLLAPVQAFENVDVLFIDTEPHTGAHVFAELQKCAPSVKKYIMVHDTVIYGERGQDGGPGVLAAVRRFCRENPQWFVLRNDTHNNGLCVISRQEEERQKLPRLGRQALNFLTAIVKHAATGAHRASDELIEQRRQACDLCEYRNVDRCSQCGCFLAEKATWKEQPCPLGRWPLDMVTISAPK